MNSKNMEVLTKTISAVESGGQVYGKARYDAYTPPYYNTPKEHTITLGWAQNYGNEAKKLIQMIYDMDPAGFKKIDSNGSIQKMLSKDWVAIRWNPTTSQKNALIKLIDSKTGHEAQDKLFAELMNKFIADCEKTYTKDIKAIMMYCEIRHLGGKAPVDRIFKRCNGNYSLNNIMAALNKDDPNSNQVGSKKFRSRHQKCIEFINKYSVEEGGKMTSKDITICGHGSGNPSTKNFYTYSASRYSQKASNGKNKGIVCVRRLKSMTDTYRKKFHDKYKTILGRNIYSQNLREYCYKKYSNGKYYSDCSSSVCLTASAIGLNCPCYNTAGIYNSSLFETVPVKISNGQVTNPEILKVGDFVLYRGNDPSRPLQIGHVEAIYEIKGKTPDPDPPKPTPSNSNIKAGQQHSINFTGNKIPINGKRDAETVKQAIRVLQQGLNQDYKAGLKLDGVLGQSTIKALGKHYVKRGEKQYMVTAAEILQYLLGNNPNGVESPGIFGGGLEKAAGASKITADMFLSYCK